MKQSPCKESAFGLSLRFSNRCQFNLAKSTLELNVVGALCCIFTISCPPPHYVVLPIFIKLYLLDDIPNVDVFKQFHCSKYWADMSYPFVILQSFLDCDVLSLSFFAKYRISAIKLCHLCFVQTACECYFLESRQSNSVGCLKPANLLVSSI
jgi:hypothetical protein